MTPQQLKTVFSNSLLQGPNGDYVFWPPLVSVSYSAEDLRQIAVELDRLNKHGS